MLEPVYTKYKESCNTIAPIMASANWSRNNKQYSNQNDIENKNTLRTMYDSYNIGNIACGSNLQSG